MLDNDKVTIVLVWNPDIIEEDLSRLVLSVSMASTMASER